MDLSAGSYACAGNEVRDGIFRGEICAGMVGQRPQRRELCGEIRTCSGEGVLPHALQQGEIHAGDEGVALSVCAGKVRRGGILSKELCICKA